MSTTNSIKTFPLYASFAAALGCAGSEADSETKATTDKGQTARPNATTADWAAPPFTILIKAPTILTGDEGLDRISARIPEAVRKRGQTLALAMSDLLVTWPNKELETRRSRLRLANLQQQHSMVSWPIDHPLMPWLSHHLPRPPEIRIISDIKDKENVDDRTLDVELEIARVKGEKENQMNIRLRVGLAGLTTESTCVRTFEDRQDSMDAVIHEIQDFAGACAVILALRMDQDSASPAYAASYGMLLSSPMVNRAAHVLLGIERYRNFIASPLKEDESAAKELAAAVDHFMVAAPDLAVDPSSSNVFAQYLLVHAATTIHGYGLPVSHQHENHRELVESVFSVEPFSASAAAWSKALAFEAGGRAMKAKEQWEAIHTASTFPVQVQNPTEQVANKIAALYRHETDIASAIEIHLKQARAADAADHNASLSADTRAGLLLEEAIDYVLINYILRGMRPHLGLSMSLRSDADQLDRVLRKPIELLAQHVGFSATMPTPEAAAACHHGASTTCAELRARLTSFTNAAEAALHEGAILRLVQSLDAYDAEIQHLCTSLQQQRREGAVVPALCSETASRGAFTLLGRAFDSAAGVISASDTGARAVELHLTLSRLRAVKEHVRRVFAGIGTQLVGDTANVRINDIDRGVMYQDLEHHDNQAAGVASLLAVELCRDHTKADLGVELLEKYTQRAHEQARAATSRCVLEDTAAVASQHPMKFTRWINYPPSVDAASEMETLLRRQGERKTMLGEGAISLAWYAQLWPAVDAFSRYKDSRRDALRAARTTIGDRVRLADSEQVLRDALAGIWADLVPADHEATLRRIDAAHAQSRRRGEESQTTGMQDQRVHLAVRLGRAQGAYAQWVSGLNLIDEMSDRDRDEIQRSAVSEASKLLSLIDRSAQADLEGIVQKYVEHAENTLRAQRHTWKTEAPIRDPGQPESRLGESTELGLLRILGRMTAVSRHTFAESTDRAIVSLLSRGESQIAAAVSATGVKALDNFEIDFKMPTTAANPWQKIGTTLEALSSIEGIECRSFADDRAPLLSAGDCLFRFLLHVGAVPTMYITTESELDLARDDSKALRDALSLWSKNPNAQFPDGEMAAFWWLAQDDMNTSRFDLWNALRMSRYPLARAFARNAVRDAKHSARSPNKKKHGPRKKPGSSKRKKLAVVDPFS